MMGNVSTDITAVSGSPMTETVKMPDSGNVGCSVNVALFLSPEKVQS